MSQVCKNVLEEGGTVWYCIFQIVFHSNVICIHLLFFTNTWLGWEKQSKISENTSKLCKNTPSQFSKVDQNDPQIQMCFAHNSASLSFTILSFYHKNKVSRHIMD